MTYKADIINTQFHKMLPKTNNILRVYEKGPLFQLMDYYGNYKEGL